MRKQNPYQSLEENPELCNHPEEHCTESSPDSWGMFYYHCEVCGQTFSRYMEFKKDRTNYTRFDD